MNPLVDRYGKEKRWVNYKIIERGGKKTKVPITLGGRPASSTNEKTWDTFKKAFLRNKDVGIVFTPDQLLLGIDIDHVLDARTRSIEGDHKTTINYFLNEADTYTEISPSETGLHFYFELTEPVDLSVNRHAPYELYTKGRYFTVTQNSWHDTPRAVRKVTHREMLDLLSILGYPWSDRSQGGATGKTAGVLDDNDLLDRIAKSKVATDVSALLEGDASRYENDLSRADAGLLSHLAFWTGKNAEQMERIWLSSKLGSRDKTQKRKDYRARSIAAAIKECKEVYGQRPEPEKIKFLMHWVGTKKDGKMVPVMNVENICRILRYATGFKDRVRMDTFKNAIEIEGIAPNAPFRELEDNDAVIVQAQIQVAFPFFVKVSKDMVYDAIITVAKEHSFDSARDYVAALTWDGEPRLDTWLSRVYGVEDNSYHRAVGSNWLKGLVKRICEPGCKFDYVLVLVGPQGIGKSTSLYTLGGPWHVETTMQTDTKDFFMQFQGKAIIEFSEGETMRFTDVRRMKAIISMQSDKYRPAYGRFSVDFPRRIVFAMTTNQEEFLKDETGNRRWLPVNCFSLANIGWLIANRDQLFAEAYKRVMVDHETTYEFPKDETEAAQEAARVRDPNLEIIADWYFSLSADQRANGVTCSDVYHGALHKNMPGVRPMDKFTEMTIADTLRKQLHLVRRRAMVHGVQANRYFDENNVVQRAQDEALKSLTAAPETF